MYVSYIRELSSRSSPLTTFRSVSDRPFHLSGMAQTRSDCKASVHLFPRRKAGSQDASPPAKGPCRCIINTYIYIYIYLLYKLYTHTHTHKRTHTHTHTHTHTRMNLCISEYYIIIHIYFYISINQSISIHTWRMPGRHAVMLYSSVCRSLVVLSFLLRVPMHRLPHTKKKTQKSVYRCTCRIHLVIYSV